jgi:ribose transport system permease protein
MEGNIVLTPSPEPAGAPVGGRRGATRSPAWRVLDFFAQYAVVILLLLLLVAVTIFADGFWTTNNLKNLLTQNTPIALVSIGMTFVIISGVFDLSVGAITAAGAVVYATVAKETGLVEAALITIAVGVAAGLINGIIVTQLRVDPFISTVGTGSAFAGAVELFAHSQPIQVDLPGFDRLGLGTIVGIPTPAIIAGVAFLVCGLLLSRSVFGRYIYAAGGNPEAARLAGIPVDRVRIAAYVLVAVGSVGAGMIFASQLGVGQPTLGAETALDAFTIVVIGGSSVYGGSGAMWRTFVGVLILAVLTNFFNFLALEGAFQSLAKGIVLVAAVGIDALRHRAKRR